MKKFINCFILSLMFLLPIINLAQNTEQLEYSNSITIEELKDHLYYLASDELEGRLTGSMHLDIAADYIITQFKQAGLKPICIDSSGNKSFKQLIFFDKYEVGQNDSLIFEKDGKKKVFLYPEDYTYENLVEPIKEKISGEVVFVGYGINEPDLNRNDFEGINIKDKWILVFYDLNGEYIKDFRLKLKDFDKSEEDILKKRNDYINSSEAKGIIYILKEQWLDTWDKFAYPIGMKYIMIDNKHQLKNDIGMQWISVGVDFLNRIFQDERFDPINNKGKYKPYDFENLKITLNKDFTYSKVRSHNIIAYIEGSDPDLKDEFVVLGAHLDHLGNIKGTIYNGADDNASGSASVLEIAEAVALSKPKRSVAFILFTKEEYHLKGSEYFVHHSPIDLNSVQLFINFDMIGRFDGEASDVSPVGYNKGPVNMKDLLNKVNSESFHINLDYAHADTSDLFSESDQYWFYKKEIPTVLFTTGLHNDFHTPADDAEKINFDLMRNINVLTFKLIMEVADNEESLRKR